MSGTTRRERTVVVAPPRPAGSRSRRPEPGAKRAHTVASRQGHAAPAPAAVEGQSPTAPIEHVLRVFATGLLIALVFGARGIVHAGYGMPDGPERSVVLAVGQPIAAVTGALRLTLPWIWSSRHWGEDNRRELLRSWQSGLLRRPHPGRVPLRLRAPLRHPPLHPLPSTSPPCASPPRRSRFGFLLRATPSPSIWLRTS
jgi:hypothetical protein